MLLHIPQCICLLGKIGNAGQISLGGVSLGPPASYASRSCPCHPSCQMMAGK